MTLGAKNGVEFKVNPRSYPFIKILFEIGTKTLVTKQSLDKLLNLVDPAKSSTEAIEFMCKFDVARNTSDFAKNKNFDVSDLVSEFMESNQVRVSVRKVPVSGKNLRHLSAIQTKYISNTNLANGLSSPLKIKREK